MWIKLWLQNVIPDASKSCGPYKQTAEFSKKEQSTSVRRIEVHNHDTIGIATIHTFILMFVAAKIPCTIKYQLCIK